MNPIWWRVLVICAVVALSSLGIGALFGMMPALVCVSLLLALVWGRDQRTLIAIWNWIDSGRDGAPPHTSGVWEDLLARLYRQNRENERHQRALSDALGSFRRAGQALPDGVVMLNQQNQIVWCNGQAEEHFNLKLRSDIGQSITNLLRHPDFLEYLEQGQWEHSIDLRVRAPVGQAADRVLSAQLVAYGQDQRLLLSRDVTKIERLETMRRDFVANVSHELKTPLTVLAGFLETIREVKLPARQQEHYLDLMTEQAERMQHLVADLLVLSALEGNDTMADEQINMAALLQRIEAATRSISAGRHELSFDAEPGLDLWGAESEVASALTNLITNAIRYTPDGGRIEVQWQRVSDENGESARCIVTDTGIGIPAQHLPRLTERFYRVERGRSRESGGTGLGLAIVKHVLTRHQGHLEVISTVGVGSRFSAVFPAARTRKPAPAAPQAEGVEVDGETIEAGG